jgi:holliday junction DNA helicase RuvB
LIALLKIAMKKKEKISPIFNEEDKTLDLALRPQSFKDYIGQTNIKKNIRIIIEAAKKRKDPSIEHLLFYGNSGLGKTTLSYLVAKEMGVGIRTIAGPSIKKSGDLAAILTNLREGDVLFIDEMHRISSTCEEIIYPAIEEFKLNLIIGKGPMARTMNIKVPRFTLIGATTRLALLSSPLRSRFGATFRLDSYNIEEIEEIIKRSASVLGVKIKKEAISTIASCSRFNPRVANRLLKRVRDFSDMEGGKLIEKKDAQRALSFLDIDEVGLESGDRKILETLITKFDGGPAGLQSLAIASSEEEETVIEIYEPYLIQAGFIKRTPRGRVATEKAKKYLEKK